MDDVYLSSGLSWLLRTSWQASVLAVVVLFVQWAFRKQLTAKWRYRLWMLVLLRLVLPVSWPNSCSIFNYVNANRIGIGGLDQSSAASKALKVSVAAPSAERGQQRHRTAVAIPDSNSVSSRQDWSGVRALWRGFADYSLLDQCIMFALLIIWPCGIFVLSLQVVRQNLRFTSRLRRASDITQPEVLDIFEDCKLLLGIDIPVRLIETAEIKSPGLYGFFRPKLLLPNGILASFSLKELRHIFLHELAHVKRLDMVVNWLMSGLQVIHWLNPMIWLIFMRIRADRELACDALVLSRARESEGESYGRTIIKLLESFVIPTRVPSGLVGILEEKEEMKRRITMIACFKRAAKMPLLPLALLLLLGLVGLTDAKIPEPLPSGLVSWWRAEDNARDAKGLNHGIAEGHMGFTTGRLGRAFNFNGADADVKVAASPSLDVGKGAGFTIEAWIKPASVYEQGPLLQWDSPSGGGVGLALVTNYGPASLYAELTDDVHTPHHVLSGTDLIKPNVFQQVVLTYDHSRGLAALYVNGEKAALTFLGTFTSLTDGDLFFGLQPYGEAAGTRFTGQIDEVQLFNCALSESEVKTLYRVQAGGGLRALALGSSE